MQPHPANPSSKPKHITKDTTMQIHIANATIHLALPATEGVQLFTTSQFTESAAPLATTGANDLTPPAMGEYWPGQGGHYICTLPALLGMPQRHLIAGGECDGLTFGPQIDVPGAVSHIDGPTNTAALLAADANHPAAKWARAYTADGHTDFHLPARLDMVMAHICAKHLFKTSGWYWSSTQVSRGYAFVQGFEHGDSGWNSKDYERRVRAFRWVQ
jgi:hypothetical protein